MPNIDRIEGFADELTAIRRDLHARPEIGFEQVRTSGIVAERLVLGVLRGKGQGTRRIANIKTRSQLKMGSEDFVDMQAVPGAYFWLGHDGSVPVHNPGFTLDDKILPVGASMLARIVETRLPAGRHA